MIEPAATEGSIATDPRLDAFWQAGAALTAPGGPFEIATEPVLDQPSMEVFANRTRSVGDLLRQSSRHGDKDYLVFSDGRRITFTEVQSQVASVATFLRDEHGLGAGDRVALCAANGPGWILSFWACAALGAVTVAMNGWWTEHEMRDAIELTEPKVLLADTKRSQRLGVTPGLPRVDIETDLDTIIAYAPDATLDLNVVEEDDPVILMFTSGTTGRPKAAVLTHRVLLAFISAQFFIGARQMAVARAASVAAPSRPSAAAPNGPSSPATRLALFPLFHISGLSAVLGAAATGSTTVWPLGRFDPAVAIDLTRREGISAWIGTGTHILRLLEHPEIERLDATQLRAVSMGGSATTPDIIRRCDERFPHLAGTMSSGYGATEVGGVVSYAPNWMLQRAPDCVGPPLPTVQIKITDESGADLPEGEVGDVWVRGPSVMPGYWRNAEANGQCFDADHWYRTGDFGRMEGGLLFIASRRRDLILRGGENVYPFEIENRLEEHPEVIEAAVVGVDHATLGQEVKAVVVVRTGSEVSGHDLQRFCAETLSPYKVPAHVHLRTAPLPRNASGKVVKRAIESDDEAIIIAE